MLKRVDLSFFKIRANLEDCRMKGCNPGGRGRLKGTFIFKIKLRFQLLFVPVGRFTDTIKKTAA